MVVLSVLFLLQFNVHTFIYPSLYCSELFYSDDRRLSSFLSSLCSTEPFLFLTSPSLTPITLSSTHPHIHPSLAHPSFLPPFHHLSTPFIATHSRGRSPSYCHSPSRMISLPRSAKLTFGLLIIFCIFAFTFQLQPSLSRDRWGSQDDTDQYGRERFPVEKAIARPSTPLFKVLSNPFARLPSPAQP